MNPTDRILAIDPGPTESALVVVQGDRRIPSGRMLPNLDLRHFLADWDILPTPPLVIEGIDCQGMPVGAETFETCIWIGRFVEAWFGRTGQAGEILYRRQVKLHLCNSAQAKDAHIRQVLLDRYGGKDAIGRKKQPGPLYGIKGHLWSALAVAVTWMENHSA